MKLTPDYAPDWESRDWFIGPRAPLALAGQTVPYNLFGLKGRDNSDLYGAWEGGPENDPSDSVARGAVAAIKGLFSPAEREHNHELQQRREALAHSGLVTVRLHMRGQPGADWGEPGTPPLHLTRRRGDAPQWVEDLPGRGMVYVTLDGLTPPEKAQLIAAVNRLQDTGNY